MKTTRFVSYLRVSTAKQGASGLGIEAQRDAIATFMTQTGAGHVAEFIEIESGRKDDRAELRAALALCRAERANLLVAKLDRLARSVAFVSAVMDSDVPLVAADNPHASRLVLHMLAAVAEFEREQISQRTKAALAMAKARGVILGANGRRMAQEAKEEACRWAECLRPVVTDGAALGVASPTSLAAYLNARGIKSRNGGLWYPSNASRLLRRLAPSGA
jgi:DNA invertase Pin-like site-specific DNA recombinase